MSWRVQTYCHAWYRFKELMSKEHFTKSSHMYGVVCCILDRYAFFSNTSFSHLLIFLYNELWISITDAIHSFGRRTKWAPHCRFTLQNQRGLPYISFPRLAFRWKVLDEYFLAPPAYSKESVSIPHVEPMFGRSVIRSGFVSKVQLAFFSQLISRTFGILVPLRRASLLHFIVINANPWSNNLGETLCFLAAKLLHCH
jgi:hypothetical protein